MLDWIDSTMLKSNYIGGPDRGLLHLTDSPSEVVEIVHRSMDALSKMEADSYDI
jgi:hypothetical protein